MRISKRTAALATLATLALGCASNVDGPDTTGEPAASTTEAVTVAWDFQVTSYTYDLDYHGGTGGNPARVSCRAGDLAVGLYGSFGNFINELGLVCAPLTKNGTFGPRYTTGTVGTPGPHPFSFQCPMRQLGYDADSYLSALRGSSGTYVDDMGGTCLGLPYFEEEQSYEVRALWYPQYGTPGGSEFLDACPMQYGITSLYVRAASWVDAVRGRCSYIQK